VKRIPFIAVTLILGVVSLSGSLWAHHGNAIYDSTKSLTMKGVVTEWWWANPHNLLMYDTKAENGEVVHWIVETGAPINMIPTGWSKESFKPGDQITITVEPSKSGKPIGRIESVTLPNGKTLIGFTQEHLTQKDIDEGHSK
jgi:hypothetical protein